MKLKYKVDFAQEAVLLLISMAMMLITNIYGYGVDPVDSVKGIGMLCLIGFIGVCLGKFMNNFVKLPSFLWLAIIAILIACPLSPIADQVYDLSNKMEFMTPTSALGAFAGISLGKDIRTFLKMGWKLIIVGLLVIAGSYIGSVIVAQVVMMLAGNI